MDNKTGDQKSELKTQGLRGEFTSPFGRWYGREGFEPTHLSNQEFLGIERVLSRTEARCEPRREPCCHC